MSKYFDYCQTRKNHWDEIEVQRTRPNSFAQYYHRRVEQVYGFHTHQNSRILEVGCGSGNLLASLSPSFGIGLDFSETAIRCARTVHAENPHLHFVCMDAHALALKETAAFDYIILSDLVNDLWDVQTVLQNLLRFTHPSTRLLINLYSHVWESPLKVAQIFRLAQPTLEQNWLTVEDLAHLLHLSGWEALDSSPEVLLPAQIPAFSSFCNSILARLKPFSLLALTNFLIARPGGERHPVQTTPSVSVLVPARNEAGNIRNIFQRLPQMGAWTELIFVEGNSTDNTREVIQQEMRNFPHIRSSLFPQTGRGKGDAVRLGFSKAQGDILMILDADLTVSPEDLPRFYQALAKRKGDFINGVRLVYPMEKEAMRFFNLIGNKFFSLAFSWVLGQTVKDTLCGTKVLWRSDYERLAANRNYFGDFDPFGDFDLLFGAAKLNLKIVDLPIRYGDRTYGTTNIDRWRHGWLLLQMLIFAARRLKFV